MCAQLLGHVRYFVTPWTVVLQYPLSMGFSRQEYWSGLPFLPTGDLPDPGIEPTSPASPALAGRFFTPEPPGKPSYSTVGKTITFKGKASSKYNRYGSFKFCPKVCFP